MIVSQDSPTRGVWLAKRVLGSACGEVVGLSIAKC